MKQQSHSFPSYLVVTLLDFFHLPGDLIPEIIYYESGKAGRSNAFDHKASYDENDSAIALLTSQS